MKLRHLLFVLMVVVIVAAISCKAKKGAGSANVRTLSLKHPGNYTLMFGNKNMTEATSITTKELAAADKMKIMSDGKEAKNVTMKFRVKLMHAGADSGAAENDGTDLSGDVKQLLRSAVSGDKINFETIRITPQGGEAVSYPPLSIDVK